MKKIVAFKQKFIGPKVFENPYWRDNLRRTESLKLSERVVEEAIQWNAGNENKILGALSQESSESWRIFLPSKGWKKSGWN